VAPAVDTPGSAVSAPRLSFACELDAERLTELFADDKLIYQLRDLGARVLMMVSDRDPRRAQVVQRLNRGEVPVVGIPPSLGRSRCLTRCTSTRAWGPTAWPSIPRSSS
jgi:hypothetical protein